VLRADAILAISHSTKHDLMTLLGVPSEKITVTHLAPDPSFRPVTDESRLAQARSAYGLAGQFILFVGTIEPRKNLVTLLKAFSMLLRTIRNEENAIPSSGSRQPEGADSERQLRPPAVQLAIAGRKGWLHQEVFDVADDLNLSDSVRFLGGVNAADLPALYSAARLLVMPSLYEGFGLPVLESMACGTAVVCSNTSSLPEVAGDAALLVAPDDAPGLADAMRRILTDDSLRGDLIQRGLRRAAQFSWTTTAQQTLAVYRAVGSRRSRTTDDWLPRHN
jgi:glycosyltransferase involved in cell wall biosynthesis